MAKLIELNGSADTSEYALGELCIIGRSPSAHVCLPWRSVSRQHAKITRDPNGFVIEDLDSGAGTTVNGMSITISRLRPGDTISIGEAALRFVDAPLTPVSTSELCLTLAGTTPQQVDFTIPHYERRLELGGDQESSAVNRLAGRLDAVLQVARMAAGAANDDEMLQALVTHCLKTFAAAERALVAVPDRAKGKLVVRALAFREGVDNRNFQLSRRVTEDVFGQGRSVISLRNPTPPGSLIAEHAEVGMMLSPLVSRGRNYGLIYVDTRRTGPVFDEDDLQLLTGMGTQMALALENAQMYTSLLSKTRAEQSLTAAREVQKRFLPRGVPKMPGFNFVAHYEPCQDVGGDLYDFIPLDNSRVAIVVGDVAGKGFAAALVMAWVTSQIREAAHKDKRPRDVLARINKNLIEIRQEELFVTLFYGVLDRWAMNLSFCNAGHMPPLVRRPAGRVVETVEDGAGLPVGMVPGASFEEGRIMLGRGDTVLLVSDGVTEALSPAGEMYGMDRLRGAMANSVPAAEVLVADVLGALRSFVGGRPQADDVTMVALGTSGEIADIRSTLPPGTVLPDL